jgi:VanZ family protein
VEFFGKLFLSGALVWVIREWGASINAAVVIVTGMALAIEVLQIWLPHENASIADPLLAFATGLAMRSVYVRLQPRSFARRAISQRARNR